MDDRLIPGQVRLFNSLFKDPELWTQRVSDKKTQDLLIELLAQFGVTAGQHIVEYGEINSVPALATQNVISYTVPTGQSLTGLRLLFSGDNRGTYSIKVGSDVVAKSRTTWTRFNAELALGGLVFTAGQTIVLDVVNESSHIGNFNATIVGVLNES